VEIIQAAERDLDLRVVFAYWKTIHAQNKLWAKLYALWRGTLHLLRISDTPTSDEALVEPVLAISGPTANLELPKMFAAYHSEGCLMLPFLHAVGRARFRSFFISPKGHMGLGTLGVQVGDEICVLLGCNQPLIVRRVGDHHLVVGQCYVYGMMLGK
jgi:hypothetical protein